MTQDTKEPIFVMFPVVSSTIKEIGYDSNICKMRVIFKDGSLYEYYGISPELAQTLVRAESVGSQFHKSIKTQDFKYQKL